MNKEIKEYSEAIAAHIEASKQESQAKDLVKKTRMRILLAKDAMRNKERELINDWSVL